MAGSNGSHGMMEQVRVSSKVRAAAKIFFIKSLIIDKVLTYSSYRPAQTGIAAAGEEPAVP